MFSVEVLGNDILVEISGEYRGGTLEIGKRGKGGKWIESPSTCCEWRELREHFLQRGLVLM